MHSHQPPSVDWVRDSPVVRLRIQADRQLAERAIPVTCGHPVAKAHFLYLPSRTLLCVECHSGTPVKPDTGPGPCGACGADDGCMLAGWVRQDPIVGVTVRICERCGSGQRILQTWN